MEESPKGTLVKIARIFDQNTRDRFCCTNETCQQSQKIRKRSLRWEKRFMEILLSYGTGANKCRQKFRSTLAVRTKKQYIVGLKAR